MTGQVLQPDAELVRSMFAEACAYCAGKMQLPEQEVIQRLRSGCLDTHGYFRYSLAQQLAAYLGSMDDTIKAVYLFGSSLLDYLQPSSNINVLLHVTQDSAALSSLVNWFDAQCLQQYRTLLGSCAERMASLLDVHVVTDADVSKKLGYGSLVGSLYNPALRIWERQTA